MDRAERAGRQAGIDQRPRYRLRIGEPDRRDGTRIGQLGGIDRRTAAIEQDEAFACQMAAGQVLGPAASAQQAGYCVDTAAERFGAGELDDFRPHQCAVVAECEPLGVVDAR